MHRLGMMMPLVALLAAGQAAPAAAACAPADSLGFVPLGDGWYVWSSAGETAPPCYEQVTDTLTLSPELNNLGPVHYNFWDGGSGSPTFFLLNLKITNGGDAGRLTHFIIDGLNVSVQGSGSADHPREAHFHRRSPPAPAGDPYQAYYIPLGLTAAQARPDRVAWTRTHFAKTLDPGQSFTYAEDRMHHLNGQFALVITPVGAIDYGNRLRGLVPGGVSGTQFAYQQFQGLHGGGNITGSALNDYQSGSSGPNVITGGFGQDTSLGYDGDDTIDGGDGDDFIFAGGGNDTASGGPGNDVIGGADGSDTLNGGDGNDYIRGSGGKDTKSGGPNADTFAYATLGDSRPGSATRDLILDFNPAEGDRIDLSLIDAKPKVAGNQAFTWIGWNKVLKQPGQLTASQSGSHIIVKANTDTDRTPELEIQLSNRTGPLSAGAFVP